jgi:hypothetical protein
MSTYEEGKGGGSSGKTVLLVVAIVAVVVLLLLGGCGVLVYFTVQAMSRAAQNFSQAMSTAMQMMADMQTGMQTAQTFVDDLGNGRVDEAYDSTTKDFQAKQSLEKFREFVDKHPALKKQASSVPGNNPNMTPGRCVLPYVVNGQDGSTTRCTVQVIKEDEKWKVDRFTVP